MNLSIPGMLAFLQQSGEQQLIVACICILGIVIAVANCLAGYRLLHVWVVFIGILTGAVIGYYLGIMTVPGYPVVRALFVLILGIGCGAAFDRFPAVGRFILCLGMGMSLAASLLLFVFGSRDQTLLLLASSVIGVLCGVLSLAFYKPAVIIITSLAGAYTAWSSASSLLGLRYTPKVYWSAVGVLALVGLIVQFLTNRRS